jgi:hypothetical protein
LAASNDLFRSSAGTRGLIQISETEEGPVITSCDPMRLSALMVDRLGVRLVKGDREKGSVVPPSQLRLMLMSETFLGHFRMVDQITHGPAYLPPDYRLSVPGYNDGGEGHRLFHVGRPATILDSPVAVNRFLDVLAFESDADRANTLAAALTRLFRNYWPGEKPIVVVTSTRAHGGKGTVVSFVAGIQTMLMISYQEADWALERQFVGAVKQNPTAGLICVDNARLGRGRIIRSAFLERFVTDPRPFLFSTGTGSPILLKNSMLLAITTNYGLLSEDLMIRALPIRLSPKGDIARRNPSIGNPKLEYLPRYRQQIDAELRGMIERWRSEGCPEDSGIRHPFSPWAKTIGGILKANGIVGFLGNLDARRTADEPVRRALGWLGAHWPNQWIRTCEWVKGAETLNLIKDLIPVAERDGSFGREHALGTLLSAHLEDIFRGSTENQRFVLKLEKARRRFEPGEEPSTRYRFLVVKWNRIPEDAGSRVPVGSNGETKPAGESKSIDPADSGQITLRPQNPT